MLWTLLALLHIFVCGVLMFVVLLQQGKGGGMGAALGGGGAAQVFGGRGAGNLLTRATATCAAVFMLTSVSLAYHSSAGDRAIKERAAAKHHKDDKGTARAKDPASPVTPAPAAPGAGGDTPKPAEAPAPAGAK